MPFTCGKCGELFETRSEMSRHQIVHRGEGTKKPKEEGPLIIPERLVDEFQYVGIGQPVRVICFGYRIEGGMQVDEIRFK